MAHHEDSGQEENHEREEGQSDSEEARRQAREAGEAASSSRANPRPGGVDHEKEKVEAVSLYGRIAKAYEEIAHEPLVAGEEWVMPLYDLCVIAVQCDSNLPENADFEKHAVFRTAEIIRIITYG